MQGFFQGGAVLWPCKREGVEAKNELLYFYYENCNRRHSVLTWSVIYKLPGFVQGGNPMLPSVYIYIPAMGPGNCYIRDFL